MIDIVHEKREKIHCNFIDGNKTSHTKNAGIRPDERNFHNIHL